MKERDGRVLNVVALLTFIDGVASIVGQNDRDYLKLKKQR